VSRFGAVRPSRRAHEESLAKRLFGCVPSSGGGLTGLVAANVLPVPEPRLSFVEFPADDPNRARRFWSGLLREALEPRATSEGEGWQTRAEGSAVGVHLRGRGPGDSSSLPYFAVSDIAGALEAVEALGGSIIHPGDRWAICRDSEGNPFALAGKLPEA
jgi:predicted enzyme related to lactoylglutathione lyase